MKIRKLIEKLERIEKEANHGVHGLPKVSITLDFVNPKLNERYFYGEISEVNQSFRPGCGCTCGVDLVIEISE